MVKEAELLNKVSFMIYTLTIQSRAQYNTLIIMNKYAHVAKEKVYVDRGRLGRL